MKELRKRVTFLLSGTSFLYYAFRLAHALRYGGIRFRRRSIEQTILDPSLDQQHGLLVVPRKFYDGKPFSPAAGNHLYEILQSSREQKSDIVLTAYFLGESGGEAGDDLINEIRSKRPGFIILKVDGEISGLDRILEEIHTFWAGTTVLLTFDGIYDWLQVRIRWLASKCSRPIVVAIDSEPKRIRGLAKIVAPVPLPISDKSKTLILELLEQRVSPKQNLPQISFAGRVNRHREKQLKKIESLVKNPRRLPISTLDYGASYIDYIALLRNSYATLNFSQPNLAKGNHLKTRVLESCLFGSVLITDGEVIIRKFLSPSAFVSFKNTKELADAIHGLEGRLEEMDKIRSEAMKEAKSMNLVFWDSLADSLTFNS